MSHLKCPWCGSEFVLVVVWWKGYRWGRGLVAWPELENRDHECEAS